MNQEPEISFPCMCSFYISDDQRKFWQNGTCLGLFQEGTTVSMLKNLVVFWLVIDKKGVPHKIYTVKNVKFDFLADTAS